MGLLELGSLGYQIGALGILGFTLAFLMVVRWWTDLLGRVLALVLVLMSTVLMVSAYRSLTGDNSPGYLAVRLVVYWLYGAGIWTGMATFLWFQFLAPRVRTTRREKRNAKSMVAADRAFGHGSADDDPGRDG